MSWLSLGLNELEEVSPAVAWRLTDMLFHQTKALLVGAITFVLLGVVGFAGTGSFWYLAGLAAVVSVTAVRIGLSRVYARSRDSASPIEWARRSLWGSWAAAACWGAWSTGTLLFEPEKILVLMVVASQSGLLIGAAVRGCVVRAIAYGQIFLTLTPLFFACLISGNPYIVVSAGLVGLNIFGAMTLTRFLRGQTLDLLQAHEEKSRMAEGLELARQELELVNSHLESLVLTDALTGIANRRAFDLAAMREWRRSMRERTPLSLLLLDVDHFKAYNDFYGHQAGDNCLQEIAATVGSVVRRPGDLLARYGGEEFAVILPGTDLKGAQEIAEAIVTAFADLAIPHDTPHSFGHVSVSVGAACLSAGPDTTVEQLTALADMALYTAKRDGRNCVRAAEAGMVWDDVLLMAAVEAGLRLAG